MTERKDPRDGAVFRFYDRACAQGYLPGCLELARLYDAGVLVTRDPGRAFTLYRSACELDELAACVVLGGIEEQTPGNAGAAAALYQRACGEQSTLGCRQLAELHLVGSGVTTDLARAFGLFERSCKTGDAIACSRTADLYRDGRGVKRDRNRALTLYDQACEADVASACTQAGLMYRYVGRDDRADDRWSKACRLGDQSGCDHAR